MSTLTTIRGSNGNPITSISNIGMSGNRILSLGNPVSAGDAINKSYLTDYVSTAIGFINVLDHGAIGDGIVDDTNSFLAAIAASQGEPIYVPPGTYLITDSLTLNNCGISGCNNSIIHCDTTSNLFVLENNSFIKDLSIDYINQTRTVPGDIQIFDYTIKANGDAKISNIHCTNSYNFLTVTGSIELSSCSIFSYNLCFTIDGKATITDVIFEPISSAPILMTNHFSLNTLFMEIISSTCVVDNILFSGINEIFQVFGGSLNAYNIYGESQKGLTASSLSSISIKDWDIELNGTFALFSDSTGLNCFIDNVKIYDCLHFISTVAGSLAIITASNSLCEGSGYLLNCLSVDNIIKFNNVSGLFPTRINNSGGSELTDIHFEKDLSCINGSGDLQFYSDTRSNSVTSSGAMFAGGISVVKNTMFGENIELGLLPFNALNTSKGFLLHGSNTLITDTVTSVSTTVPSTSIYCLSSVTLDSLNSSVTYGISSTLKIKGPPVGSGNITITHPCAINVESSHLLFSDTANSIPSVNTRSNGTRIVIKPSLSVSTYDIALGYSGNNLWLSSHSEIHFYSTGSVFKGSIASTSVSTGQVVVEGGCGISGDLYVGGTLYLSPITMSTTYSGLVNTSSVSGLVKRVNNTVYFSLSCSCSTGSIRSAIEMNITGLPTVTSLTQFIFTGQVFSTVSGEITSVNNLVGYASISNNTIVISFTSLNSSTHYIQGTITY